MRLQRNDIIAGCPVKTIRRFLQELGEAETGAGVQFAAYHLKMDEAAAATVLSRLMEEGFIEPSEIHSDEPSWSNTIKGNAVAQVKFRKPISRDKATIILNNFLLRIARLNADPYFFRGVSKIEVFGSYLSEAAFVNDIDLFVYYDFKPSFRASDRIRLLQDRIRLAQKNGRRFPNITSESDWPRREVELYIRARERRLSLHHPSDGIYDLVEKKVIFSETWS